MAAIRCPHCNQYISSTLAVCPECGAVLRPEEIEASLQSSNPSSHRSRKKSRLFVGLSFLVVVLGAGVFTSYFYLRKGGGEDTLLRVDSQFVDVSDTLLYIEEEPQKPQPLAEVTPEECQMLRGALDLFLMVMTGENAQRIDSLIAQSFTFCDSLNVTGLQVVSYCKARFRRDDILGVHFVLPDSLNVTKNMEDTLDIYRYDVTARIEATYNRSSIDSLHTQSLQLDAQFTPDRKVRSIKIVNN